jgi:hypothetical protein
MLLLKYEMLCVRLLWVISVMNFASMKICTTKIGFGLAEELRIHACAHYTIRYAFLE